MSPSSQGNPRRSWRVRITDVRPWDGGLRWTLEASSSDEPVTVYADTSRNGALYDLQAGPYVGWTGDKDLDHEVAQEVRKVSALRGVLKSLDSIDLTRSRSDRLRRRWAA